MRIVIAAVFAIALTACGQEPPPPAAPEAVMQQPEPSTLEAVLAAQPDDVQARYTHRHPQETLQFFGIEPGMTVVEALPGGGWYSKVLLPYLGADGRLVGANYPMDMWPRFGFSEERIAAFRTWTTDWPMEAGAWHGEAGASVDAFEFGSMPESMAGTADAVLLIRALHNLARFEADGGYLTAALADAYSVLKPGGIVGVVQHEARADMPDEWSDGTRGYLKRQWVIDRMTEAGFEFVAASEINQNPNDRPGEGDVVWRLPPGLSTSREDPELRARMEAIGESNRMTLLFRKPM
jgi:predicted methyltransferase